MKGIFSILIFLALTPAFAQTYSMNDDSIAVTVPFTDMADQWYALSVVGHLTNNTSDSVASAWKRNIIYLTPGWSTTVCDPAACGIETTDSANFIFLPNLVGTVNVDFKPNLLAGHGIVKVNFHRQGNYTDSDETTFFGTVEESTGVSTIEKLKDIKIFPNPAKEKLMIAATTQMFPSTVEVYDVLGKKINATAIKEGENLLSIDVRGIKSGFYFIRMKLANGAIITRQFTKD